MSDIKEGDKVRLKSGGPTMMVDSVGEGWAGGGLRVYCEWFDEKNVPKTKDFNINSVEKV